MYRQMVIEATRCPEEDAAEIEDLMRLQTGGTLDHLRRGEFDVLARVAMQALVIVRKEEVTRG